MKYAGIGGRDARQTTMDKATQLAWGLGSFGWTLSSGGAKGMDTAFEKGADVLLSPKQIYQPRDATVQAVNLAASFHPAWNKCSEAAKSLLGRNAQIILGRDLDNPVKFVLYWCLDPERGGTSLGLKIAMAHKIPIYDIMDADFDIEEILNGRNDFWEMKNDLQR